jgi:hypothetical protein
MRSIKTILGIGCVVVALWVCGLAIRIFFDSAPFGVLLTMAILAACLANAGRLFIIQRDSSLSQKSKILILLPVLVTAILLAMVPLFVRSRSTSAANGCLVELRQIDAAAQEFALESEKTNGAAIDYPSDLTPYFKDGTIPTCPRGGVYSIRRIGDKPTCSLSNTVTPAHILP